MNTKKQSLSSVSLSIFFAIFLLFCSEAVSSQITFTISNLSGGYSITCTRTVIILSASSNYSTPVSYSWTSSQTTATSNSIAVTNPTNYTLTAASGSVTSTQTLAIGINTVAPSVTLTSNFSAFTCIIFSIAITAPGTPSTTYQWFSPPPSFDPAGAVCYAYTPGTHTCIVTNQLNGCKTTATIFLGDNRIYPVVVTDPVYTISCPGGTVSLNTSVTGSTNNLVYTWSNETGTISSGGNMSSLVVNSAGDYQVAVTNTLNGCTIQKTISVYACVGIANEHINLTNLKLFPNPAKDKIWFDFSTGLSDDFQLYVTNTLGQVVLLGGKVYPKKEIDLGALETGIYYLNVFNNDNRKVFKLIKD